MANPKTKIEKQINATLKELNRESKQFTAKEFLEDKRAVKLKKMFEEGENYVSALEDPFAQACELDNLLYEIAEVSKEERSQYLLDKREILKATKDALGLNNMTLIKKIAHLDYREKCGLANTCSTCGSVYDVSDMDIKIARWVKYCQLIDQYMAYVEELFPDASTRKAQLKEYVNSLVPLSNTKFMRGSNLQGFIEFFSNYGLNQSKSAKADYLLSMQFPNICVIDSSKDDSAEKMKKARAVRKIAIKVVEDSVYTNKMT